MARKNAGKVELTAYDDLFETDESREEAALSKIRYIPIAEIDDFPDHPFKVLMDEDMEQLVESVKHIGIATPATVRLKENGRYELISGHRRKKAFAYKMRLEAMNRQAGRPAKNNLTPVVSDCNGMRTNEVLAKQVGESRETIRRFIRLTELIPSILDLVDDSKIAMRPAVELSYLPKDQQEILLDTMQAEDCTPSHAQAIKLRKFSEEGRLNEDVVLSILAEEKGNQKEQFRMPKERINKYFSPGTPAKQMEDTIIKALEMYRKRERNKDQERER